jgi:Domain of unknown function (DUF4333)
MRRTIYLAGATALALIVTGCGTKVLNTGKLEKNIQSKIAGPPFNLTGAKVKCPDRDIKKGDQFNCTLTLKNGTTSDFHITQVDAKGNVNIKLGHEISTYVQNTLSTDLASQGVKATASCPNHVAVVTGATFTCSLVSKSGQHGTATLTILDDSGAFRITSLKDS